MTKQNSNITIVLGILCIILAAGLIVAVANYSGQSNTSDLESQVTSLQNQINSLNNKISDYETQIDDLTYYNDYYASVIALEEYAVLIDNITYQQNTDEVTILYDDEVHYAGYMEIQAETTSDTTYLQVSYTYGNVDFDQTFNIGNQGTVYFPVLPGTITITLGNTETNIDTETIDTTVTITYIY
jgi:type II secretory pathway pseudopilin PulG